MRNLLLTLLSLLLFTSLSAQCNNLFFSEYIEGSSNNKAIEIYNPTNATINLTGYVIYRYNNGATAASDSLFPQGTLAPGAVWVAANPSADTLVRNQADTLHTITFYNGDDALELRQISTGLSLDIIGVIGVDPGTNWPVGTGATSEFTLVRKATVNQGNTNWAVSAGEWDVFPQNTFTFIGSHTMNPCGVATNPTVSFAAASASIAENGGSVNVTVNIASPNSSATSVDVVLNTGSSTATGGGTDFTYATTTITFPANDSTPIVINIPIVDDLLTESNETIVLDLANVTNGGLIGTINSTTITIIDNDLPPIPTYPIGTINTVDANGVGDSTGVTCWIHGVVYGVNMRPAGLQFTLIDPTGGIGIFEASGNLGYTVNETDSIKVRGTINQFNGLLQINPDSIVFFNTGNTLKMPTVVTTLVEANESDLIRFDNATLVNPAQWTGTGSGFNVDVTNGVDTIQVRIDNDVNLYSQPAPTGTFSVCGIGGQFDSSSPYTSGYQLLPRYIADIKRALTADLGQDQTICTGNSVTLGANNFGDTYLWNTGDMTQTITVNTSGTYSVIVTDTILMTMAYDTVVVTVQPNPTAAFGCLAVNNETYDFTDSSSNATSIVFDFGDGNTSTSANPTHTYANPGTYTVILTATNNCGTDTTSKVVTILVGIENGISNAVRVFPNPSYGQFKVELTDGSSSAMTIEVLDAMGRLVHKQSGSTLQEVNLANTSGIYFVRVSTENGVSTSRVILK